MDANEAKVREVWDEVRVEDHTGCCGGDDPFRVTLDGRCQPWAATRELAVSAAAAYTETALEEAAELREEIEVVEMVLLSYVSHGGATWLRILARLEAAYAVHIRGIKPEALK